MIVLCLCLLNKPNFQLEKNLEKLTFQRFHLLGCLRVFFLHGGNNNIFIISNDMRAFWNQRCFSTIQPVFIRWIFVIKLIIFNRKISNLLNITVSNKFDWMNKCEIRIFIIITVVTNKVFYFLDTNVTDKFDKWILSNNIKIYISIVFIYKIDFKGILGDNILDINIFIQMIYSL